MNDSDQLEQLLSGFHSCVSIITQEEAYARRLVTLEPWQEADR